MKLVKVVLATVVVSTSLLAGCQENERKVERRETIRTESEARPIVVPDAPQN